MKINIIAVGDKQTQWVDDAYDDYHKRFPQNWSINNTKINTVKRTKNNSIPDVVNAESKLIIESIPKQSSVVSLDLKGQQWSTLRLAEKLQNWHDRQQPVSFIIGGPDGLSNECLARSDNVLSLSLLTFPHHLARVILIEQLYRAWSIMHRHPYHRF